MSARETVADRGRLKGIAAQQRFVTELREARLSLGKSQLAAAREAEMKRPMWTRIERGTQEMLTLELAGRMSAAVGLDFVVHLYPSDGAIRDSGQVPLLRDTRPLLGPDWRWRYEVSVGEAPDQRAWDAVATHVRTRCSVAVEAETRLRDIQATLRRLELKRVAAGGPRIVLAIRDSRHNRLAVKAAEDVLGAAFPVGARAGLARLRQGEDPGGDVLLLVGWRRKPDPPA